MVHKHLDFFKLHFLARPAPAIDLTAIHNELSSLRSDVYVILEMRGAYPEGAPTELDEDTILE